MEFFWEMLSLQETMFLLILTGVLIKKLKIIDAAGRKMLSDLLIDVILPCNIVESFLGGMVFPDGFARNCLLAVGLSAVIQLMSIYGSKLLFRKYPREQRSVLSYGIICSNSSFVGLPVARLLFGDLGVIYTSMFQIPLRFTMWTAGLSLFTSVSRKDAFRKLVRHPCIIAVFAGLLLMAAPVSLPGFLDSAVAAPSRSPCSSSGQSWRTPPSAPCSQSLFCGTPACGWSCTRFCCAYCSNRSTWTRR